MYNRILITIKLTKWEIIPQSYNSNSNDELKKWDLDFEQAGYIKYAWLCFRITFFKKKTTTRETNIVHA